VLDDVEGRRFLVEPAREDSAVAVLRVARLLDVQLDEGAGQLLRLPRRTRLAGPQPHDRVADAGGLAGPQNELLGDAVALVEEAEHRDALVHRRRSGDLGADRLRHVDGARRGTVRRLLASAALAAGGERGEAGEDEKARPRDRPHPWSGVHAS